MKKQFHAERHSIVPSKNGKISLYYNISQEEMEELIEVYKLDAHTIASALDPDEVPSMDYEIGI